MKRTDIPNLTPDQCDTELVMMDIRTLLQKARKASDIAHTTGDELFKTLNDLCIDLEIPTAAENASTLEEAITCYISYNEYNLRGLMKEIRAQYEKQSKED